MVCDTWIFGERGLVDMLVLTYFFLISLFTSLLLYLRYFFIFPVHPSAAKGFPIFLILLYFQVGAGSNSGQGLRRRGKE